MLTRYDADVRWCWCDMMLMWNDSDVSCTQLVESLKERDLIKFLGDFRLETIFSKLRSSDKKIEIDESRKVLEELIYMVNNN